MELSFAATGSPPRWHPDSPGIEMWADRYGVPCAYGQIEGERSWMHVPGVGSFELGDDVRPTLVWPLADVPEWLVRDTFYRTIMPTALQLHGCEVLHASAVVIDRGVVSLCAHSETGKSTLAYALHERGHQLYADDAVVFEFTQERPRLRQVPFSIRLRRPSAEYFDAPPRESSRVTGELARIEEQVDALAAICILERVPEGDAAAPLVAIERLGPAAAFPLVLPHAYCFTLRDPRRKALMMRQYLTLLRYVAVYRVRFRPGLENLEAITRAIEEAVVAGRGELPQDVAA